MSGHKNHIAVFKAVKRLMNEEIFEDLKVYVLKSTGILRKYISLLDLPFSVYSRQVTLHEKLQNRLFKRKCFGERNKFMLHIPFMRRCKLLV